MRLARGLVPIVTPALGALRARWRSAIVIALLGASAFALLMPAMALRAPGGEPAIQLPGLSDAGPPLMGSDQAQGPATTQSKGVAELLKLLIGLAWVGFGIAGLSVFSSHSAQSRARASEIGIRRAVGASLRKTTLSLLFEALVLAAIALVAGIAIGSLLRSLALSWWPGRLGEIGSIGPLPALAVCALLGAAGLTPLLLLRNRQLVEPADETVGLKVPVFQVAVSIALLMAAAGLLAASRGDPRQLRGEEAGSGVVVQVDSGSDDPDLRAARLAALLDRASAEAGVSVASLTSPGALLGLGTVDDVTTDCGQCYFGMIQLRWPHFTALEHAVSPDSFRAGGQRLVDGRLLGASDRGGSARVAVVNRQLASRYFQGGAAVGRDIYLGGGWPTTPYRVVGIVEDERAAAIGGALQPRETVYLSVLQLAPRRAELLLRTSRAVTPFVLRAGTGTSFSATTDEAAYRSVQSRAVRWFGAGFGIAALLALAMALAGTFFTMREWADSVLWELSLRRALGARKRQVFVWVLVRTAVVGLGGLVLGGFLYGSVLLPALGPLVGSAAVASPGLLARVAVVPVLLAILVAALPGFAIVRRAPGPLLH